MHNNRSTGLDYMEEILSYLALQGLYNIDLANAFNLLSATDKWQNTCRAHLVCLQHCKDEPFFRPVSPQVHHLRETNVRGVWRSVKLPSIRYASEDIGIPNFRQLFRAQMEQDWRHKGSGLGLEHDQNVPLDSIVIQLQNGVS
jgi:hypothetical protein